MEKKKFRKRKLKGTEISRSDSEHSGEIEENWENYQAAGENWWNAVLFHARM